mgnify:CR=1 FL=1
MVIIEPMALGRRDRKLKQRALIPLRKFHLVKEPSTYVEMRQILVECSQALVAIGRPPGVRRLVLIGNSPRWRRAAVAALAPGASCEVWPQPYAWRWLGGWRLWLGLAFRKLVTGRIVLPKGLA